MGQPAEGRGEAVIFVLTQTVVELHEGKLIQLDPFGGKQKRETNLRLIRQLEKVHRFWLLDRSFRKDLKNKQTKKNEKNCKV